MAGILFVVALAIGLVANNPRYVFAIAAFAIFGFVGVGFFIFPHLKPAILFRVGSSADSNGQNKNVLLAGLSVSPGEVPQNFVCALRLKSWTVLVLLGLFSLSSFCFLVSNVPLAYFAEHYFLESIYLPALLIFCALEVSMRWYSEQRLLARSTITLAIVTGSDNRGQHRRIAYQFQDAEGGYYGGIHRDFLKRPVDQMLFVVYDRSNPDVSCSSRGFIFRDFKVYPLE